MAGLFAFIFLATFLALPIAIIKPSLFSKLGIHTRKKAGAVLGTATLASFMALGFTAPPVENDVKVVEDISEKNDIEAEELNSEKDLETKVPTNTLTPTTEPSNTPTPTRIPTTKPTSTLIPTPTKNPTMPIYTPVPATPINNNPPTTSNGWICNCAKTCTQISSCGEAQYLLNICGCGARDADKDGIACDSAPLNCQN